MKKILGLQAPMELASGVAFPGYVIHFETFEIVNERLHYVRVLEHHCFLGLVCVGNMSLDKLQICVASLLLDSDFFG